MEPEGSLLHSQVPATCPYPEPAGSSPYPHIPLPEYPSKFYPPIYVWVLQVVSFPQVSTPKPCTRLSFPPYALHSPPIIPLDFITRTILGEENRSLSSSLCSFLHSLVTSSLLGPNILNTLFSNTLSLRSSLNASNSNTVPIITVHRSPFSQSKTRSIKYYRPLRRGDITTCAPTIPMTMGDVGSLVFKTETVAL